MAAETQQRFDDMSRFAQQAFRRLADSRGLERYSMPFYRHALDEMAGTRDPNIGTLARRDPKFAAETLATYTGLYDTLLRQAQNQFVADAREQLFFQYKIDNSLHALTELYPAMPRSSAEIADTTFRLAQLRSFGRLTLATLSAELGRSGIDPQSRFSVERFFTLSTQTAVWLRRAAGPPAAAPDAAPPDGEALWKVFFTLDVFYNETTKEFERYTAFVRQKAPRWRSWPRRDHCPCGEFQRRLRTGEAIVATLVTPRDLYVWAITQGGVTVARQRIGESEIRSKVQRLRAGLRAGRRQRRRQASAVRCGRGLRDLSPRLRADRQVAAGRHRCRLVRPRSARLGAARGARDRRAGEAEAQHAGRVCGHTGSSSTDTLSPTLADLSLFPWHRDKPPAVRRDDRFLGVGAPLLTTDELAGGPRSRTYELAGGLDGKELSQLPKLAESVDEMKGLAAIIGESNSTLWLGPEASEKRFTGDGLRGYQTIALATHGFVSGEVRNVPEPALMLALEPAATDRFDGILTSREIAGLQLDANLVMLSACNTAAPTAGPAARRSPA